MRKPLIGQTPSPVALKCAGRRRLVSGATKAAITKPTSSSCRSSRTPPDVAQARERRDVACRLDSVVDLHEDGGNGSQTVEADVGGLRDVAQQRLARRCTRHIKHRAQQAKQDEPAKIKPEEGIHDGQGRNRGSGAEVGEDRHPAAADLV